MEQPQKEMSIYEMTEKVQQKYDFVMRDSQANPDKYSKEYLDKFKNECQTFFANANVHIVMKGMEGLSYVE